MLRGGAFKPRTSPYSFQGLGESALKMMAAARAETGLKVVTEVVSPGDVGLVAQYADVLQLGTRNMQNYALLQEAGRSGKPVLLKRGMSSTIEEWLLAAEYVLSQGNRDVILCERGIRTFETATRFTLDLNAIPLARELSHLPIIVDPSQATGKWSLVRPMALAAVAAGAHGLIVEVHPTPNQALSDGAQSLDFEGFDRVMQDLGGGHPMCGRGAGGIEGADAELFKGAPWILTRDDPTVRGLVESVGAHPLVMDAATHDRLVAGVSHAALLLSVGYVLALSGRADWSEASNVAASGFRDMSRLAAGEPELAAGISRTNRENLLEQLDAISNSLTRLRRHLEADDPRLVELFEEARAVRERWSKESGDSDR